MCGVEGIPDGLELSSKGSVRFGVLDSTDLSTVNDTQVDGVSGVDGLDNSTNYELFGKMEGYSVKVNSFLY